VNTIVLGLRGSIDLNLSSAAPAVAPFQSEGSDTVWRCSDEHALPPYSETNAPPHAYPALVHLGWAPRDGAITFADLEHVGLIHLDGPVENVQAILGELAFGFETTPSSARPLVHVTGVPAHLYSPGRYIQHSTLEDALDATRDHAKQARSALRSLGFNHPRDARLHDPSNDLWRPRIILSGHQPDAESAEELGHILDARPKTSLGVVARAPSPGQGPVARWTVTLEEPTATP
jgi:hypothetical protein